MIQALKQAVLFNVVDFILKAKPLIIQLHRWNATQIYGMPNEKICQQATFCPTDVVVISW
jgi:hypothetical protein